MVEGGVYSLNSTGLLIKEKEHPGASSYEDERDDAQAKKEEKAQIKVFKSQDISKEKTENIPNVITTS